MKKLALACILTASFCGAVTENEPSRTTQEQVTTKTRVIAGIKAFLGAVATYYCGGKALQNGFDAIAVKRKFALKIDAVPEWRLSLTARTPGDSVFPLLPAFMRNNQALTSGTAAIGFGVLTKICYDFTKRNLLLAYYGKEQRA